MDVLQRVADQIDSIEVGHSEMRDVIKDCDVLLAQPDVGPDVRRQALDVLARAQRQESEVLPELSESLRRLLGDMLADAEAMGLKK